MAMLRERNFIARAPSRTPCRTPGHFDRPAFCREVCRSCYNTAAELVRRRLIDWKTLEDAGKVGKIISAKEYFLNHTV